MKKPTLIGELNQIVGQTSIAILRAQARGYEEIVDILFRHGLMDLNGYSCHEQSDTDTDLPLSPEGPSFTDAQPTINAAPAAPEEPPAARPAPEAPRAPTLEEELFGKPRRRGRPRKAISEDVIPSLLPHSESPAEPVEAPEPTATPDAEPIAVVDDDLPW